jgi:hypothetical protein
MVASTPRPAARPCRCGGACGSPDSLFGVRRICCLHTHCTGRVSLMDRVIGPGPNYDRLSRRMNSHSTAGEVKP